MIFSSWPFILVFLPLTAIGFFAIPIQYRTARKVWLTLASVVFYGYWRLEYVPLIVFSILFNYGIAEGLLRCRRQAFGRWLLATGVGGNLLLLGYFKYANFLVQSLGWMTDRRWPVFDIVLPLAISFFTFTQIAYLVDVYRDDARHYSFLDYSLFVVFYPHLIAGPIVRHWEIIPQYAAKDIRPNRTDLSVGLAIFLVGLYKKLLLADPISGVANAVFAAADGGGALTMFDAWFGALAYSMQLYFDFSGYSDMAIGLARLFSIRFPMNFDSPYQATSISEFWRRWHITLTRFLREYLYFPLGGNRCGRVHHSLNIFLTMLASGLWHGAGWTFVAWGALHGFALVLANYWQRAVERWGWRLQHWIWRGACVGMTFLVVLLGWVLFRASSFPSAGRLFTAMFGGYGLTVPFGVGEAQLGIGRAAAAMGATIVPTSVEGLSYRWGVHGLILLCGLVWCLPNTQQWLRDYEPVLGEVRSGGARRLRLGFISGVLLGIPLFSVIRVFLRSQPSLFLYFNF